MHQHSLQQNPLRTIIVCEFFTGMHVEKLWHWLAAWEVGLEDDRQWIRPGDHGQPTCSRLSLEDNQVQLSKRLQQSILFMQKVPTSLQYRLWELQRCGLHKCFTNRVYEWWERFTKWKIRWWWHLRMNLSYCCLQLNICIAIWIDLFICICNL